MVKKTFILYTRNFIFGSEDSLVSTVGLLAGIASAGVGRKEIIVSGIVLIFVEAFSMSIGSFLSEVETEESSSKKIDKSNNPIIASGIMLVSYIVCGLIPLAPYFFMDTKQAFWWSIVGSIVFLFVLGLTSAKILKIKVFKTALRMTIMGGLAIGLGVIVGLIMK
jgi:VIT1/CCC1 family predicted Fe2+/Mn2+ transporter